jgi:hypothetical protein
MRQLKSGDMVADFISGVARRGADSPGRKYPPEKGPAPFSIITGMIRRLPYGASWVAMMSPTS